MQKVIILFILSYWKLHTCYYQLPFVLVVIFITQNINQNKNIYCHFKTPALNYIKNIKKSRMLLFR